MAISQLDGFLRRLRAVTLLHNASDVTDAQLLESFITNKDEAAFAALVRRHGPMVWGVCRRVLGHVHDAEDAFQATFLVLVRKAATVVPRAMVGNWLYGVAYRTAMKARATSIKRRTKEKQVEAMPETAAARPDLQRDLQPIMDQELDRLPKKYRAAVVLCDLQGKTHKDAARQLGWRVGTLSTRLVRARALLAKRLARHGFAISGGALAIMLSQAQTASACVPTSVVSSTIKSAALYAAGKAAAGLVSTNVAALAEGVLKSMLLNKLKLTAGLQFLASVGIAVSATLGLALTQEKQGQRQPAQSDKAKPAAAATRAANEGRIHFQRFDEGFLLTTIQPDGQNFLDWAKIPDKELRYQSHSARLSPDGKRLAFGKAVVKEAPGVSNWYPPNTIYLWEIGKPADPEVLVVMEEVQFSNWVWSPDGTKLALCGSDSSARNWVVDTKTKKAEEVKLPRFKVNDKEYTMCIQAWSPDGTWFLASGDGLYLVKTNGSTSRQLTKEGKNLLQGTCRFSPDGRHILFTGVNADQKTTNLYVVDTREGKVQPVVEATNLCNVHGCWSPDGRRIAYCASPLNADGTSARETSIFVTDSEGKNTVTALNEKHDLRLTDWR